MKLTPLEIRKMEFGKSFRGYHPEEVEAFLETVADQVEVLQREANDYSDKVVRLETQVADFQMIKETLQETLLEAKEMAKQARLDAQKEAELIVREAQVEGQRILDEARRQLDSLNREILALQNCKDSFIKKFKHLLKSQGDLIDIMEENSTLEEATRSAHDDHPPTIS